MLLLAIDISRKCFIRSVYFKSQVFEIEPFSACNFDIRFPPSSSSIPEHQKSLYLNFHILLLGNCRPLAKLYRLWGCLKRLKRRRSVWYAVSSLSFLAACISFATLYVQSVAEAYMPNNIQPFTRYPLPSSWSLIESKHGCKLTCWLHILRRYRLKFEEESKEETT